MQFHLPSGVLTIQLDQSQVPLFEALLHVGVRQNPKRGFLLISKILGKHLPVRPSTMLESYRQLATQLPSSSHQTFIGMAETATALGQGVFEAYAEHHQSQSLRYLSSTRYPLEYPHLTFEETHSHAPSHYLHLTPDNQAHFAQTKSLVLIDDEISTGQTLLRLAWAFKAYAPRLEQIVLVSLTDFLGIKRQIVLSEFPVPTTSIALLKAGLAFAPNLTWQTALPPSLSPSAHCAPYAPARVGCLPRGFAPAHIQNLAAEIAARGQAVQVLGTGEFQFEPFLLALALERLGIDVVFRATTRSPILEYGIIAERLEFSDNYDQGLTNYLYNPLTMPTIVCSETPATDFLPLDQVSYCNLAALAGSP